MMSEGFLVFASSSTIGSFLLCTLTFIGTTHLLWTFCSACREKKKKKSTSTPVAADPNDAQTNDGDQQQPVEASKLPPKKDPKTTKSLRESNNIKKNSRNGRPKNGKNNKGNYPAQGNTISSVADNTGTKSFATTKGVKPKATAVGNIDEKIKGMPQGQMAEGLALQHRFDHASQKDKFTRNGVSKGVKIVEQENMLYITDDVSKTRSTASSRTAEVAAAAVVPPANEGREPMDSLKYAHHQDSTEEAASTTTGAAGGTAMEEQKPADAAAGEKKHEKETKSRPIKSGQDSDYL